MRFFIITLMAPMAVFLTACGDKAPAVDVDPQLGRACFAGKLAELPPGSQYEGIAGLENGRLSIRIMDGKQVTTVDCALAADGSLAGK